jgi:prepilin-type N-terminal cleavage/methylation domain-containing protein
MKSHMKQSKFIRSSNAGFTLIEGLIVAAIIAILALYGIPKLLDHEKDAKAKTCKGNLSEILNAKQLYAREQTPPLDSTGASPSVTALGNFFTAKAVPPCPSGGTYDLGATIGDLPTCSVGKPHSLEKDTPATPSTP